LISTDLIESLSAGPITGADCYGPMPLEIVKFIERANECRSAGDMKER